jgi:hypothetical protein
MNKNFDNVILFPGVENKQVQEIETRLSGTQIKMNTIMMLNDYDRHPIDDRDLMDLAEYGDVMSFASLAARRLISCLAAEVLKQRQIIDEIEEYC